MSLDKIKQLASSISKSVEDNENIATQVLAFKLSKAIDSYPEDKTIGAMSIVINKMADNNTIYIKRGELKSLYNKLYSRNTKFADLFHDELGITEDNLSSPQVYKSDYSVKDLNPFQVGDSILSNALESVFDNSIPVKMYSKELANKAINSVASTLDSWNVRPSNLSLDAGNDKFLVIKADYETPKGLTNLFIPVEINNNKISEASVFFGNNGPEDLDNINVKKYLTSKTGVKLKISAAGLLDTLTKATAENREVSAAELALTKLTALRQGKSEFFQDSIVGQKIDKAAEQDVNLPRYDDMFSFEKQFTSANGLAEWRFGADKIKTARDHIVRELTSYGHKNPQVAVSKADDTTVFYNVSLNAGRVGFVVPVKIANNTIIKPNIMLCNGSVSSFNQESINELYINNSSDFKAAAAASPLFNLKPSEVLNNLRDALKDNNYAKAEDSLNVLANCGDEKAYAIAFNAYMTGLSQNKQENLTKCAHIMTTKHSEHPICSQTNLPVHKVYQDKDGNCRPLYRKGMDETYEGAYFNNSKIFG